MAWLCAATKAFSCGRKSRHAGHLRPAANAQRYVQGAERRARGEPFSSVKDSDVAPLEVGNGRDAAVLVVEDGIVEERGRRHGSGVDLVHVCLRLFEPCVELWVLARPILWILRVRTICTGT